METSLGTSSNGSGVGPDRAPPKAEIAVIKRRPRTIMAWRNLKEMDFSITAGSLGDCGREGRFFWGIFFGFFFFRANSPDREAI